jgi:predicted DNA-binding antitoxin AbrB/MazE fold protein
MGQLVRAIYENGRLRLLDPVDLAEGQEIELVIPSKRDRVERALGDLLVRYESEAATEVDEAALMDEIDTATRGKPSVSEAIIEERREGP